MWSKILGSFSAQRLYFCDVNESWDVRRLATWDVPTFKKFMRLCSVSIFRHIWHQHKSEWTQCTFAICNWLQEAIDSLEKGELADEETVRACKHLMTHVKNIWIFIVFPTSVGFSRCSFFQIEKVLNAVLWCLFLQCRCYWPQSVCWVVCYHSKSIFCASFIYCGFIGLLRAVFTIYIIS